MCSLLLLCQNLLLCFCFWDDGPASGIWGKSEKCNLLICHVLSLDGHVFIDPVQRQGEYHNASMHYPMYCPNPSAQRLCRQTLVLIIYFNLAVLKIPWKHDSYYLLPCLTSLIVLMSVTNYDEYKNMQLITRNK